MDPQPHPEPTLHLPRDAYYQLIHILRTSLQAPVTDTPEDLARRDNAAIAQSLPPGLTRWSPRCCPPTPQRPTSSPSMHATGHLDPVVAVNGQAMACLWLARDPVMPLALVLKCSAQPASIACPGEGRGPRQSQGALRMLLGLQAARPKIEANAATLDRAAWTEHCTAGLMAQALSGAPPAPADLPPPPPPPPAPAPEPDAEPVPDPATEAEEYALIYPLRAALIRRLPDNPLRRP